MTLTNDLIESKTANFVGRQYIFDAMDEFIQEHPRGYFILKGDPGAGKTSILAEYIQRKHCIGHFNLRAQGLNTFKYFIESLRQRISELYGHVAVPSRAGLEFNGELLVELLTEIRSRIAIDRPAVIAVDALDEVNNEIEDRESINPLYLPSDLPEGVYLILTTRRLEPVLRVDAPFVEVDLGSFEAETMNDVRLFLRNSLNSAEIATKVDNSTLNRDEFVTRLADLSEGNFMYLRYALADISKTEILNLDGYLAKLPKGLENYYEYHWRLMGMNRGGAPTLNAWIIYVLCEAAAPLAAWVIASVLKPVEVQASAALVQNQLAAWLQFLHRDSSFRPNRYSIYHASFRDFLHRTDVVANAGLDLKNVNQVIADLLWQHEFGDERNV